MNFKPVIPFSLSISLNLRLLFQFHNCYDFFYIKSYAINPKIIYCADLEALPNILQKKYSLLRDLDKSLQGMFRAKNNRFLLFIKSMFLSYLPSLVFSVDLRFDNIPLIDRIDESRDSYSGFWLLRGRLDS